MPPKCKMCGKDHYGTCLNPRLGGTGRKKEARPKKKSRIARRLQTGVASAVVLPDGDERLIPVEQQFAQDAPRRMRPAAQLPVEVRITALEQIVDELLAGKRKRSEYMKAYMRDRRAGG